MSPADTDLQFTAVQVAEAFLAGTATGLESAAQLCESVKVDASTDIACLLNELLSNCAKAIRGLKSAEESADSIAKLIEARRAS